MHHPIFDAIVILLALSVFAVALLRRVHLPAILGYLAIGALAGQHALGLIPDLHSIEIVAEIGVIFLLFMIGLEFSIPHMLAMKGIVLGLGGAQVVLTAAIAGGIAYATGLSWQAAFVIGGAAALSSTAIAARQLTEQLELHSRHGRIALGVLIFQDLAVVPFLVLIPIFGAGGGESMTVPLLLALAKGVGAFLLMFALGHWVLRPLFHMIAGARSVELFTLTILLVALAAAWVTNLMGLSLALGAFLAGMMLGETEYRHQIEIEIRPFRDVLMGLFFITVGTQVHLDALPDIWHWVLLATFGLVVGKGVLIFAIVRLAGYESGVAMRSGAVLAQGGEFGFALLALAISNTLLDTHDAQVFLTAIVLSMALAPLIIRNNGWFAKRMCASYLGGRQQQAQELSEAAAAKQGHVILCGFGRIGQNLATFLEEEGIDYVGLDVDPLLIREAHDAGEDVFYGDSTHADILEVAGVARARALVVTVDEEHVAERITHTARKLNADLPIIVRTRNDHYRAKLEEAGASDVVPESMEASMMLAEHLLRRLGVPAEEVLELIEQARADHYRRLRGVFHGDHEIEDVARLDNDRLHTVVLEPGAHAIGMVLGDCCVDHALVEIEAVRRGAIYGENPSADLVLQEGDAIVLRGPVDELEHAENRLIKG
ncbi:MAG: cation:proton antiporter [Gammaproteobacteria bacterium]|nr:cation:proton antiporter [Gammaproteobacteria bacterium]